VICAAGFTDVCARQCAEIASRERRSIAHREVISFSAPAYFPEDPMFQETGDQENFQARYVLRHSFNRSLSCAEGRSNRASLATRHQTEARTLADLRGWKLSTIQHKRGSDAAPVDLPWYERIWR